MSELLPCPFCGGEAQVFESGAWFVDHFMKYVRCTSCGLQTCDYKTEAEAVEAWNTRTKPAYDLEAYQDGLWAQFRRDFKTCHSERTDCFECSECAFIDAYVAPDDFNYCPNCGARVTERD